MDLSRDPGFIKSWNARKVRPDAQWMREEMVGDWDASRGAPPFVASALAQGSNIVAKLNETGAPLVLGSDRPSASTYGNPPGLNGRLEIQYGIDAGVSEEALFRARTLDNAERFHLDDRGTIEAGKKAHMLLLRENPLEDVAAHDPIVTVFSNGVPIPRGAVGQGAVTRLCLTIRSAGWRPDWRQGSSSISLRSGMLRGVCARSN